LRVSQKKLAKKFKFQLLVDEENEETPFEAKQKRCHSFITKNQLLIEDMAGKKVIFFLK